MLHLPVHFRDANSARQFVAVLEQFPYPCDLISGTRSVDAKSLIGVLALSHRTDLELLIHEVPTEISGDLLRKLHSYTVGNLKNAGQQSA